MQYQRFLDVSEAADAATFQARLLEFAEDLGFGLVGAIVRLDLPDGSYKSVMLNNAPPAFFEATRNVADSQRDPVLDKLKRVSVPFVYDQSAYVAAGAADLWEEQATFGYKTGIAAALHLPGGKHFMLGFDRAEALPQKDEELTRMLASLQLMAVHAQSAALRLFDPTPAPSEDPRLTKRELEVLQWASRGKTAWETAQILNVSRYTVTFHMRGLLAKLRANSKHHAILNAMAMGLI
jgi:DNA-binding CsgD family transcriptional regulator